MVFGLLFSLIPTYGNLTKLGALLVGFVYPTLMSFQAIESSGQRDDTQWLMYWVTFTSFTTFETLAWYILTWIPLYRMLRVAFFAWLAFPQTRGASEIYVKFVKPFLLVAVEKAKTVPALEPYVRSFGGKVTSATMTSAAQPVAVVRPASPPPVDFDALKREAVAKVEETFEHAKAAAGDSSYEAFQPLKTHAQ